MTNYLLAGGGTAGHVNPLLAVADQIRGQDPTAKILALGTAEGLEARLVPERGYDLATIEKLPFPRKPGRYAASFPLKLGRAVRQVKALIAQHGIDVVIGFGGYASAPAYLAARSVGIPVVVHEANALPGFANKLGSRFAAINAVAFSETKLRDAIHVGMPLRAEIADLAATELDSPERDLIRSSAREFFGLEQSGSVLLVTGGSLGAKRINDAVVAAKPLLYAAGIQVLHIVGGKSDLEPVREPGYVRIAYCDRMDLAIAAANFAVSRAGASTVCEFAAVGLPAAFVPYPVGNGEQSFNVAALVRAEGGLMVEDPKFDATWIGQTLIPLISNTKVVAAMARKSRATGIVDASARLVRLAKGVLRH